MRYIRTKDGIYEVFGDIGEKKGKLITVKGKQSGLYAVEENDKFANAIEKLCDGILVEEIGDESNWFIMETNEFEKMSKEEIKNHLTSWRFNFFIKNDKGLIYSAKLNDEGDPILL